MSFTLGLTGGIASGKSLVGQHFLDLGVVVIDADQASRSVVKPGSEGLEALTRHFGNDILDASGQMDRARMRERVFSDPAARLELEAILHPLIRRDLFSQRDKALQSAEHAYCILMIPLLVKFGWADLVDRLLVVDCSEATQLERLQARDDIAEPLARNMLLSQDSRKQRLEAADDIILNEGSADSLLTAVQQLHKQYQQLGQGIIKNLKPQSF